MEPLEASRIVVPGAEVRVVQCCTSTNSVLLAEAGGGCVLLAASIADTADREGKPTLEDVFIRVTGRCLIE